MELAVTHIHGEDRIGPGLEEAVGEAARRGSGVEGPSASDVDAESGECGIEFLAAPAHEPGSTAEYLDGFGRGHHAPRLECH
jgi:hypothetical protein